MAKKKKIVAQPSAAAEQAVVVTEASAPESTWIPRSLVVAGVLLCAWFLVAVKVHHATFIFNNNRRPTHGTAWWQEYAPLFSQTSADKYGYDVLGPIVAIVLVVMLVVVATPLYREPMIRKFTLWGGPIILMIHVMYFDVGYFNLFGLGMLAMWIAVILADEIAGRLRWKKAA